MTQNLILGAGILTWILLIVVLVVLALKKEKYTGCAELCSSSTNPFCYYDCKQNGPSLDVPPPSSDLPPPPSTYSTWPLWGQ